MALIKKISFGRQTPTTRPRGKFIVIEGTDGSGKTTQTTLLKETLLSNDYDVEHIKFPQYGNKSAGAVEQYLEGHYGDINPYAASVLYAVDRFDASFKIRELLDAGKIIICERYVTSNAGHQGANIEDADERIKYFKWLDNLEYNIFKIPKPDLNIILHVPAHKTYELVQERAKKEEIKYDLLEKDLGHLKRAEQVYLEIARLFPNTKLVECMGEDEMLKPHQIHNKVWELVRRIALKNSLPAPVTNQ